MPVSSVVDAAASVTDDGDCCGASCDCGTSCGCGTTASDVTPRQVSVEFSYLDLNTCERCVATGDTLDEALAALAPAFDVLGVVVTVNKVNITTRELAEQYRFVSSPTIRVNGVDICTELKESHCGDCSDLSGCSTVCRVFVYQGREYEQPPAGMIADGILRVLYGQQTAQEQPAYVLPENLVNYFNGRTTLMKTIAVFEPAMCCNTGVCGPDPAQELVTFTADLDYLKGAGVDITRYNLANDPMAFAQAEPVRQFLEVAGSDGLPLTLVNGAVALTGRYPSRAELSRFAGLDADAASDAGSSGCGCGSECGCAEPTTEPAAELAAEPVVVTAAASSGCGCGTNSGCC